MLGYKTRRQMKQELTASEFKYWVHHYLNRGLASNNVPQTLGVVGSLVAGFGGVKKPKPSDYIFPQKQPDTVDPRDTDAAVALMKGLIHGR